VINALKTDLLATHPASKNLKDDQRSFNLKEFKGTYQLTNSQRERERERERATTSGSKKPIKLERNRKRSHRGNFCCSSTEKKSLNKT
jgi:hypothetical protein